MVKREKKRKGDGRWVGRGKERQREAFLIVLPLS